MFTDPEINAKLLLDKKYHFMETPHAPGVVYAEIGRKAKVYKVKNGGKAYALKAFKPKYRSKEIVENTSRIAKFADVPSLSVANRLVITPDNYPEAIENYPAFAYAVLMPWIEGMSWFNFVSRRTPLKKHESLRLAHQFIDTIVEFEKKGLAHCDLSGGNFVFSEDFCHVELIDIEDMFGYDLIQPTENPVGTKGYVPNWLKAKGAWEAGADRFAASILVCEILGWQSQEIRDASSGDTYFADGEFGHKSKRFRLLNDYLKELHPELARLFQAIWYATSLEECPRINEWKDKLELIEELELDKHNVENDFIPEKKHKPVGKGMVLRVLAPVAAAQNNQYKLYYQTEVGFQGYIRPDGSLTKGENPFSKREVSEGIGFLTPQEVIEWVDLHGFKLINKRELLSKSNKTAYGFLLSFFGAISLLLGFFALVESLDGSVIFLILGAFLFITGWKQILNKKPL